MTSASCGTSQGLLLADSICSAETSSKSREHALRTGNVSFAIQAAKAKRATRTWTAAGAQSQEAGRTVAAQKRKITAAVANVDLVREFALLGGGPEAIETLSIRHGVDRKSMQARLRRTGAEVPDARLLGSDRRRRISNEDRDAMVKLYEQGLSQSQIAAHFQITQSHASRLLRQAGAAVRPFHRSSRSAQLSSSVHLDPEFPTVEGKE